MDKEEKFKFYLIFPAVVFLFFFVSCTSLNYTLTVIVEDGVTGIPSSGNYVFKELSTVEFFYTPINELHTVEVWLNDKYRFSGQDSIVLYGDQYVLRAKIMDVRGKWKVKMVKTDSTTVDFEFTITLEGSDGISGTFTDSRGYHGIWQTTYADTGNVITLTYSDWEDYVLTGTYFSMSGIFTGGGTTGTWSSERVY